MSTVDIRVGFIGDSYMLGVGDEDGLGWAGRLCVNARRAGHPLTGYNLGVRRDTSRDIARRWQEECARRLPAGTDNRVLFSFGLNDVMLENGHARVAEAETLVNLQAMLKTATARYRTLLVGPVAVPDPGRNSALAQLSAGMSRVARDAEVPYLDLFTPLQSDASWLDEIRANDGAHPRAAGYARLASLIEQWPSWWFTPATTH